MKIIQRLERSRDFWFLVISLLTFFILRFPSLFEPYWYGDEGIYQTIGLALNRGAILYRDIWDNKPPLLYYLYAIFGSDQFLIRIFSLITGLLGVTLFFFIAKNLFQNRKIYFGSTILFSILFGLPIIEGNIANAENFMIPLSLFSVLILLKYIKDEKKNAYLFLSGLILGISFLFKIVAVFDFAAFLIFISIYDFPQTINIQNIKNAVIKKLPSIFIFSLSFALPFMITLLYFFINKSVHTYLVSMLFSNIGYVGYGNKLIIPQGLLIFKMLLLGTSVIIIFFKKNSIKYNSLILIFLWISFSLFNAFFSQRPYPHYLLVLLPSFCLLFGSIFIDKKLLKYIAVIFILVFLTIFHFFSFYEKDFQYYFNFVKFVAGSKNVNSYQSFFDGKTPRDYEIASFINSNAKKEDNIFVWGDNAQLYKMTDKIPPGKYTVLYHIDQYPDGKTNTSEGLKIKNPKYIIIMPGNALYPFPLYNYRPVINIGGALIYERIT